MAYSRGVLIHNFNEDQYGADLRAMPRAPPGPKTSVSHTVHHWKVPEFEQRVEPTSMGHVDRHVLFGHAGDMRDPRSSLQKTDFGTAHQYFMQDPKKIPHVGHLSADGFTMSDHPKVLAATHTSHLATSKRESWGDLRQTHSLPPNERFLSETKRAFRGEQDQDPGLRMPRHYGEFTRSSDKVNMARSTARLRSAGRSSLK